MAKLLSTQLRINMASGVFVTFISLGITTISYPLYLHFLGYEQYGLWLVMSTVLTFAQLGNLGINSAISKVVAEEYGRNDFVMIQKNMTVAITLLLTSGFFVLLSVIIFNTQIVAIFKLSQHNAYLVGWLLPYIGVISVYVFIVEICNSALSGLGRMDLANSAQLIGRITTIIVSAGLLNLGFGIKSLLIANFVSYVVINIQSIYHVRQILKTRLIIFGFFDRDVCKRLMRLGGFMSASSVVLMLFDPFNKMMLSRYVGVSIVPVYDLAFRGCMQLRGLVASALQAFMPEVSRLAAKVNLKSFFKICALNKKAVGLILLSGATVFLPIGIFCDPLLRLWLGKSFDLALPFAFRISLITVFISLLAVPSYYTLLGLGKVHHLTISHLIQSGVNVCVVLVIVYLKPSLLLDNIYFSILAGTCFSSIYLTYNLHKELVSLKIRSDLFTLPFDKDSLCED